MTLRPTLPLATLVLAATITLRVGEDMVRHAERAELGLGDALDAFPALQQVVPEGVVVIRAREGAGHADLFELPAGHHDVFC